MVWSPWEASGNPARPEESFNVCERGCAWDMTVCGAQDEVDGTGAVNVWLAGFDGMAKGLAGWARGFVRLPEGSTVEVEDGKEEVWAGAWEVVWADRQAGSILAEMRLPQVVEWCGRAECSKHVQDLMIRDGLNRSHNERGSDEDGSPEMTAMASPRYPGQGMRGSRSSGVNRPYN